MLVADVILQINVIKRIFNLNHVMKKIKIWNNNPSEKQIDEICDAYKNGEVVILPTDTLYAITCNALDTKAIERLCRIKDINPDKTNLSIICSDISMASEYARFDNAAFHLLRANTPGPFTFLFRASSSLPRAFKGRKIVGIRIPANNICRKIAETLGSPILTSSIDYDEEDYAINPDLIAENYEGKADLMVEGEEGTLETSTIVDDTTGEPEIIRKGKGILV